MRRRRWVAERTTRCPVCREGPGYACTNTFTGETCPPHPTRRKWEQELAEARAEAQDAMRRFKDVRRRVTA